MRIHHRICDAQKHLLQTLVKRLEKLIKIYVTDLGVKEIIKNVLNINFIEFRTQQRPADPNKSYTLHVKIHHRICDAQKHLLQTLVKRLEKLIDIHVIDLGVKEIIKNVLNINLIECRTQQRPADPNKSYTLHVKIHHRICDAQKHLLQTLVKRLEKLIDIHVIDLGVKEIIKNVLNINFIEFRTQQRPADQTKCLYTRCENSSQNL